MRVIDSRIRNGMEKEIEEACNGMDTACREGIAGAMLYSTA